MEDLFDKEGHLTKFAINSNIEGNLDELHRLEISEHISFCEKCLEVYIEALTEDKLLHPFESCSSKVEREIEKTKYAGLFRRYATVFVAACFTMMLWVSGIFSVNYAEKINQAHVSMMSEKNIRITEITKNFTENISDGLNNTFKNISLKGVFE